MFSPVTTWGRGGLTVRSHGSRAQIPQPSNLGPLGSGQWKRIPSQELHGLDGEFLASGSVFGWAVQGCQITSRGHHLRGRRPYPQGTSPPGTSPLGDTTSRGYHLQGGHYPQGTSPPGGHHFQGTSLLGASLGWCHMT